MSVALLPQTLRTAILRGEAILFLGAGASRGCKHPDGRSMPMGNELRDLLCEKFLSDAVKDRSLEEVATFVENQAGRPALERFVADQTQGFEPSMAHLLLPTFRWRAVFGTNYDLLLETAYERVSDSPQTLKPFYRDQTNIERELAATSDPLPYFKLHGSIDHIYEPDAPLIITTDSYVDFERSRRRLFFRLEDLAREYPIVFVGTRLADAHLKALFATVEKSAGSRPMYYFVAPDLTEYDEALLQTRRMHPLKMTFGQLMSGLDQQVDTIGRALYGAVRQTQHSIEQHFRRNVGAPDGLLAFLTDNVEHVHSGLASTASSPEIFFRGESHSWSPIEQNFDFERRIYDTIMLKILGFDQGKSDNVNALLIRGAAGSGKSVFLRRIAHDLAVQYSQLVLFAAPGTHLRAEPLLELHELTGKRTVLIVDQAADRLGPLVEIGNRLSAANVPITIVLADTHAALGSSPDELGALLRFKFEIRNLIESEITALLFKLEEHKCLGLLEEKTPEQRLDTFVKLADRQLLVALYEATQGKPLEDILLEEYHRIALADAQELYLLVCTLHRFRVPVRAGLILRVMGISFNDFEKRFLGPLEGMVFAQMDPGSRDYAYRTRHAQIADIVFRRVLETQSKQVEQFIRIMEGMNTTYSSDNDALRKMVNFRTLRDLVTDLEERRRILRVAERITDGDPYVLQQQAMLEMYSKGGDLEVARQRLDEAQELRPKDRLLKHSRANLLAREAEREKSPLARKAKRRQAWAILKTIGGTEGKDPYVLALRSKLSIDEIADKLQELAGATDGAGEPELLRLIEDAERALSIGLGRTPDFVALIKESLRLKKLLGAQDKGLELLKRTLAREPHLEFVAITYARAVMEADPASALAALRSCLVEKPNSRPLNQMLFELMIAEADDFRPALEVPMRKAFILEDGNVLMHVHAIRHYFMTADAAKIGTVRDAAKRMMAPTAEKSQPRLPALNPGDPQGLHRGTVARLLPTFAFIQTPGLLDNVFLNPSGCTDAELWDDLREGTQVVYQLRFNVQGAIASHLQLGGKAA